MNDPMLLVQVVLAPQKARVSRENLKVAKIYIVNLKFDSQLLSSLVLSIRYKGMNLSFSPPFSFSNLA